MKKIFLLPALLITSIHSFSQKADDVEKTEVMYPVSFGISKPLSELALENPYDDNVANKDRVESSDREHRKKIVSTYPDGDGRGYGNDISTIQTKMGTRASRAPLKDWAGQSGNAYPPDPSGAVGPSHYVQAVNFTPVRIYDKSNGSIALQIASLGSLWSPVVPDLGDPIVLYDKYADRWFIAQFGNSNKIYIAISQTPDPTGAYYTYTYTATSFPDYLKFSIWHDGYYMTSNTSQLYVFERAVMLTGGPGARMASMSYTSGVSGQGASFFCPLSADADGTLPTTGPCPMVYPVDNAWGSSIDGVKIRNITTNWGASPSVSLSAGTTVTTSAHDMSYNGGWNDISQPGTAAKLDGIGGVATFRAQWRQWTGYNTIVLAWNVKISATQRAIKWAELRQTGSVWSLYQEGVYAPDTKSRWVPSIAMNDFGHIGLSYARASSTNYASCGYTGRLKTDSLGLMTFAETMVPGANGTHSQVVNNRFGDYGQNAIDPSDGCTFWSTMEYLAGGTPKTRVWAYQIGSCAGAEVPSEKDETLTEYNVYQNGSTMNVEANKLITNEKIQVDLFDINGRIISSKEIIPTTNSIKTTIDVSGLSNATYLVRLGNLDFQKVIKVFVK